MRLRATLVLGCAALLAVQLGSSTGPAAAPPCRDGLSHQDLLVFVRGAADTGDIWTTRGDRTQARRLTATGLDAEPALSPDGSRVAFWSKRDGNGELYLVNADGTGLRRLTQTPDLREVRPTWHPDGRRLAFHSLPRDDTSLDNPDLEVLDVVTGARSRLTDTPGAKEVKPAWSPDGRSIAFEGGEPAVWSAAPNDDIWVLRLSDGRRTRVTDHPGREWYPAWSPDGRHLAFMSGRDGTFDVYVARSDGTAARRVTTGPTYDTMPTWSPDGTRIVYAEEDDVVIPTPGAYVSPGTTSSSLVSVRPDGSGRVVLTSGAIDRAPSYLPCRRTRSG